MSFDWSFEYPVTLDLCREDEVSGRAWFLAEIEVIARIGPGPDVWKLEAWCYVGAMVDRSLAAPKGEDHVFAGRGSDPLDAAIEQRLRDHEDSRDVEALTTDALTNLGVERNIGGPTPINRR